VKKTEVEHRPRRIAVILGPGSASRYLLDRLRPLLAANPDAELQGVFLEEAGVQHAAELPFVKELCRVTFAVREFNSVQFERSLALRMRSARQALAVLAGHAGVRHHFRNVRGSAVSLLQETIRDSDITAFEPARPRMVPALKPVTNARPGTRVSVLLTDPDSAPDSLRVALQLAEGEPRCVSILMSPGKGGDAKGLRTLLRETLPSSPAQVRPVPSDDLVALAAALREQWASVFVVPATAALTEPRVLQFLLAQVRCPVCLVRTWAS
jgi:hypothetical protein